MARAARPAEAPSPRRRGGWALLALFALGACGTPPPREEAWRARIRETLFVDALAALEAESHGTFEAEAGVVVERVTYATQFGLRVPAILYRPASPLGRIPALVVVNGHGGDKHSWYAYYTGVLYARAGAAVLTYDPAGEGERNAERKSGTRAHDRKEDPPELARRLAGLMITDALQAVSYLRGRPEVDPSRIGVMGYSLGSFVVAMAGAIDDRIRACVLVGGGNLDGPEEYWDNTKPMCQGTPYRSLAVLGDRPAVIYALHASRGPTLIFNGLEDEVVRIPKDAEAFFRDLSERVTRLRGDRRGVFDVGFEPGASHRPFFVTRPVALWLERHLDFPNWNESAVRDLPETLIGTWAEGRNAIERTYNTAHREAGTRALGSAVPHLSREQLSVFTREEWDRRRGGMIHESWLERARAAVSGRN